MSVCHHLPSNNTPCQGSPLLRTNKHFDGLAQEFGVDAVVPTRGWWCQFRSSSMVKRRSNVCRRHDCGDFRSRSLASSDIVPCASSEHATCRGSDKSLVTQHELWKDQRDSTRQARISGSLVRTTKAQSSVCELQQQHCVNNMCSTLRLQSCDKHHLFHT